MPQDFSIDDVGSVIGLGDISNALLEAIRSSDMFSQDYETTDGATWGYTGGTMFIANAPVVVAKGTVSLSNGANYVEVSMAGVVSVNGSAWTPATKRPLRYLHVTNGVVDVNTDARAWSTPDGSRSVVAVDTHYVTLAGTEVNYLLALDFSAAGVFGDDCYVAQLTSDEPGVVITRQLQDTTTGKCSWVIFIPSEASPGTYGGVYSSNLELALTAKLAGYGWSGGVGPISNGTWDAPVEL